MFLTLTQIVIGQQNYQDNIFLKNGKIISGIIIDQVLNKTIRFVSIYGDSINFNLDEIEKLTRIKYPEERRQSNDNFYLKPRYELIVQTSLYNGIGKFGIYYYKLSIINGIRFNRKFALGFGAGIGSYPKFGPESYFQKPESEIFPVFIDLRDNYPITKKGSGYSAFDIGYTFSKNPIHSDLGFYRDFGFLINLSTGIGIEVFKKSKLQFGIGLELQHRKFTYYYEYYRTVYPRYVNKVVPSLGINACITF